MAITSKGSRNIEVNGHKFIWKIKKHPNHNERHNATYNIPIQHIEGGQLLLVSIGYCRSYNYEGSKTFQITPSIIARCIKRAINEGWSFLEKLPPLEKDYSIIVKEEAAFIAQKFIKSITLNQEENEIASKIQYDAQSLIDAGEYQIALENVVANVCEYDIELSEDIIDLAIRAFIIYENYEYTLIAKSIKKEVK